MVDEIQKGALSTRQDSHDLWNGMQFTATTMSMELQSFLTMLALVSPGKDPDLVKRIGAATALEVRATGIPYVFAPCIAVCRNPRWGRCYESYSEDYRIVKSMTEIIPGLQGDLPAKSRMVFTYVGGKTRLQPALQASWEMVYGEWR
ncbi:hypothetical protein HAX54_025000 [Datura stramonium]|uniref:Glycoside hydrolase family 3 N-terminal domain-containing protein n=1 Tax=Datura stramonium TaxID=4076 RepID=A0ABS8UZH6_DATST|nr:hypothetical protein [Datura stramonium]